MTARLLSGKEFAAKFKEDAAQRARALEAKTGVTPGLAVIIVGEDPASQVYVRNKDRACAELGIYSQVIRMAADTTKDALLAKIDELNYDKRIHGILVQLPLPEGLHAEEKAILDRIDPAKDVDGFHPVNVGRLALGEPALVPCTPHGCLKMLELADIPIDGQRAVIVGRSNIVGKPMAQLLLAKNATVTICHSHTKDLASVTREADILVAAVGKPRFITADMVKPGATVIDVGINRIAPKKLVGDVDFEAVSEVAGAITPVPGGVGLLTVAMLMENVVTAAELQLAK
ncbi:MAG: bifunctional methylenetetrahydrofolate dehydrogenase/methenyltetrahydrofolate cyclohydrolase FolD [Selenomonas sp.]|uniref:bifunctional methylenetetrahydrofolate dehydrogenase/methenyltetrahydrofolate cyclohydrolase FolD n=1 Tax=Selenomonas sp. TaxID=2053611 RepID=UPI0025E466B4|nr:bifunctional methylenetetrahydrofolate dehydrogenase/methenyltetrahydrofolate cyclohydrolase FolD [Selenomonas sp.]MCI6084762.1 bifunctional methylenetetrahydrofolate dehydrogenase/methenyltetrahydrofolate cyclohydrolase FolD [Selenomonas sp.]MDY4415515.1 bifunctional methylenetetrahydrofolate dehydrogenase/methenyltetrahydrofolate cyclohydrolase FolD [Selenomonas sp.]